MFLNREIREECINCKISKGMAPGGLHGLQKWGGWGDKEIRMAQRVAAAGGTVYLHGDSGEAANTGVQGGNKTGASGSAPITVAQDGSAEAALDPALELLWAYNNSMLLIEGPFASYPPHMQSHGPAASIQKEEDNGDCVFAENTGVRQDSLIPSTPGRRTSFS